MTTGEKIAKHRKENNYTQEQLAEILGVSRQSVSKWESDIAYPETEKLIRLGKLFGCSMDYLLNEDCTDPTGKQPMQPVQVLDSLRSGMKELTKERKSEKLLWGLPLYHIGRDAHGFFAVGGKARGVFAIGLRAKGVVSLGLMSIGVVSIGLLSGGLIALGLLAMGALSVGSVALGLLAAGAVSIGIVSFGALSLGGFSVGGLAIGRYAAVGDYARAMIAIGDSVAEGSLYRHLTTSGSVDMVQIRSLLDIHVPGILSWARAIFLLYLQ